MTPLLFALVLLTLALAVPSACSETSPASAPRATDASNDDAAAQPAPIPSDTPAPTPTPEPRIAITNAPLLVYLRRTLHESARNSFTQTELSMILYAGLEGPEVESLNELALLQNLETLTLTRTRVTDVTPLAKNGSLQSLTIENDPNAMPDAPLAGLEHLAGLSDLTLIHCPVADRTEFLKMPALKSLTLIDCGTPDDIAFVQSERPDLLIRKEPTPAN